MVEQGATTSSAALTALGLSNYAKTLIDDADAAAARGSNIRSRQPTTGAANSVAILDWFDLQTLNIFDGNHRRSAINLTMVIAWQCNKT